MNARYQPLEIEAKWQKRWQEDGVYEVDLTADKQSSKPKFYAFGMFSYPSGEGIHVGHVKNFTIPDVLLRFKRQSGWSVYAPVGFDSFGLPAENFALKTGISPTESTQQAITTYSQQYQACGFSFDWSKVIQTSHPLYYRWTQWCFLQFYKAGVAYQATGSQWWCEACCSVLANEQVINGKCWRHDKLDDPLINRSKNLKQWFLKITDYADEILAATENLNWTDWVKKDQQNYIGKSVGVELTFKLQGLNLDKQTLKIFTTAIETLAGATFIVLAPEHPLVAQIIAQIQTPTVLRDYVQQAQAKTEVSRKQAQAKTGLKIEGLTTLNPLTGAVMSVWVADYVLVTYATGAIMAVPANDERDLEFARAYDLPIIYTTTVDQFVAYKDIAQNPTAYILKTSDELHGLNMQQAKQEILQKLATQGLATTKVNYKLHDWLISRQRYWGTPIPIIYCEACGVVPVPEKDLPVLLPEIEDYKPAGDGRSPLFKAEAWLTVACPKCGQLGRRETDTMDTYVCSSWYQLRYLSPHSETEAWNQDLAKQWLPVDFYNGADHATAHLLYARFFTRFFYDQGLVNTPEPFARMYYHGKILASDGQMMSKSKGTGVDPLDIIKTQAYGADALRVYICAAVPPDFALIWDDQGIVGAYRFLNRAWTLVANYLQRSNQLPPKVDLDQQLLVAIHGCIAKNNQDIENLKYNTALAAQMELVNIFYKLSVLDNFQSVAWQTGLEALSMLLAPFAPHLASELWHKLGHDDHLHLHHWPKLETKYLTTELMIIVIQVDGKLRGQLEIDRQTPPADILKQAKNIPSVARYLKDAQIQKEIYKPGMVVNFALSKTH